MEVSHSSLKPYIFKNDTQMWKLHRKLNFFNIFRLAAIYTWAPAFKHDLLLGSLPKHDALGERVQGVHQLQFSITAQRDHLVHLLQFVGDDGKPRHELIQSLLTQVLIVLPLLVPQVCDLV